MSLAKKYLKRSGGRRTRELKVIGEGLAAIFCDW